MKTSLALFVLVCSATLCDAQTAGRMPAATQETIHTTADVMPEFPGSLSAFLAQNITYPKEARQRRVEGRVIIKFVVAEDGSITDAIVERGVDPVLDAEALQTIQKMPKWRPAIKDGKPVKAYYRIPVRFNLS